jgi:uncharacterized protein YciI
MPERLQILRYEYVDDIEERRGEYREAHLAAIQSYAGDGRIVIAGAVGDPVRSGLLVFREAADAEAFAESDPYVKAGLVVRRTVEPWNVVTPVP